MSEQPDFIGSVQAVRAIAVFIDRVAHLSRPKDLRHGADIVTLAEKRGIKVPAALLGYKISYNAKPHSMSKRDLTRSIVVQLPPRTAGGGAFDRTIKGCFDLGKGPIKANVCVSCDITWTHITCSITITIKVGF
jgi:hypothetical protein